MPHTKENFRKNKMRKLNRLSPISRRLKNFIRFNSHEIKVALYKGLAAMALILIFIFWGYKAYESATKFTIKEIKYSYSSCVSDLNNSLTIKVGDKLSNLDIQALTDELTSNPRVRSAKVTLILPDILHIEIKAHIPIAYVEMENAIFYGKRERYFVSNTGTLFAVDEKHHRDFLENPVWYLQKDDIEQFALGQNVSKESLETIIELITAVNRHELDELPLLKEIFHPKEWKFKLNFEGGTEVIIQSHDMEEQIERLVKLFDHAKNTYRHIRSANVIPKNNPAVVFYPAERASKQSPTKTKKRSKD